MGGKAALMFLKKYPDILEKLIVADIGLKEYPMHHEQILMGLNNIDLQSIKTRSEAQEALGIYVKEIGVQQFLLKNLFWIEKLSESKSKDKCRNNQYTVLPLK